MVDNHDVSDTGDGSMVELAADQGGTGPRSSQVENEKQSVVPTPVADARSRRSQELAEDVEYRVHDLARAISRMSRISEQRTAILDPFQSPTDPALDPASASFDAVLWTKSYLSIIRNDPERYPERTLGVSYRELNVYGFGSSTDYQKDFVNIIPHMINMARNIFRAQPRIPILTDFDGLVRSGEMCLVLGRPGSGVSTLLKTIAGKTHGLQIDNEARFNYQGITREMMLSHFRGEIIYQAETDVHFPHLTVGQTLMFAAMARTPKNRVPGLTREQYAEQMRNVVMTIFGLTHTVDTKLGNDYVRGVSGGERKRVSIAEVILSQSPLQCWDNSTRGLDSASALQFVHTLKLAGDMTGATTVVALYQASEDAYNAFQKVAVLYEGRQIYFGRCDEAKTYFTNMGYICPPRQTTADFLTSLTNPIERIVAQGYEDRVPRTPDEFADRWFRSEERHRLLQDIDQFENEFNLEGSELEKFKVSRSAQQASLLSRKSPYTISVPTQVKICMIRGFQRLRGEKIFTLVTIAGNIVISLIVGSIFFLLPATTGSFFGRSAVLFVAVLFNALTSALEIIPLYSQRPIVEKHASFAFVHPFSEAIASMICELPSKIICTIVFNVPLYFMVYLRREAGNFFIYLLFAFCCTLSMSMIFRTIGQLSRTLSQAMAPIAFFILGLIVYTGFILPIRSMQGWLRWLNYLNPVAYAFEALMANEFHGRDFPCVQFIPAGPAYENATGAERTCSVAGGLPGSNYILGDTYINATYQYYHSHVWRNFGILLAFIIFFMAIYLVAAEELAVERSKGEVLVFRRGHKYIAPDGKTKVDEETGGQQQRIDNTPISSERDVPSPELHIQRQTAIFHWKDVCYRISIKGKERVILDHVDGWVKPGTLTALMGASGAGKTSLLNTLAKRVNVGVVSGDFLVNGQPCPNSFQRQTGYVQQQDIHLPTSTVREALRFSALLRQPENISREEKLDYVEEVIRLLEMEKYCDAIVGVPGEGLNIEQRKRLTIGVELAAKPDLLLFLDEPTSGLDSQTAWSIAMLIRKLASNGQAILCTIHQPSAILFQQFDRLLLLAKGGRTVYFGDIGQESKSMIGYFEKYGAQPCGNSRNPAEWVLEVIGAAPGAQANQDWVKVWRESSENAAVAQHLHELKGLSSGPTLAPEADKSHSKAYASPFYFQLYMCTKRAMEQYWRDPSYIYAKLGLCLITSLFLGVSFYKEALSLQGMQNQMFSFFMLLIIQVFMAYQAMPNFIIQRDLYEARERPAKTYSWKAFMVANILVEIPWNSLAAVIIFVCMYYPIGMYRNAMPTHTVGSRGGLMFFLVWTFMMFGSTFTDMVVAGVGTAEIGAIIAVILFALSLIFCGVLATPQVLPGFWIFMYRVSPFTYLISAFLSTGLANDVAYCTPLEMLSISPPDGQTCGKYLAEYMAMAGGSLSNPTATQNCQYCQIADTNVYLASINSFYSERWRNLGFLWVYVVFNACAAIFLYWLARVPKQWRLPKLSFIPKVIEALH